MWNQIKSQNIYLFHTGDNKISDVKNPRQYGFDSSWSILSYTNNIENELLKKDFDFAAYLRSLRLKNPFDEEIKQYYWYMVTINVGMLILFVQLIDKLCKHHGFEYIGFCGRDTYYMYQIYKKYQQDNNCLTDCDYLYYSRKLIDNCEKDISKYFLSKVNNRKALMIDIVGTGKHLNKLRQLMHADFSLMICLWFGFDISSNIYKDIKLSNNLLYVKDSLQTESKSGLDFCIFNGYKDNLPIQNHIELINRATHNSPVRLKAIKIGNKIVPEVVFSQLNDSENLDVFKACMKEVLSSKIQWFKINDVNEILLTLKMLYLNFNNNANKMLLKSKHQIDEMTDNF